MPDATPKTDLFCSFCQKHEEDVETLISGPGVYICSDCVVICNDCLANPNYLGETDTRFVCSFCGKQPKTVKKLIPGPTIFICDECIELCNEILAEQKSDPDRKI